MITSYSITKFHLDYAFSWVFCDFWIQLTLEQSGYWGDNPLGNWKSPCDFQLFLCIRGSYVSLLLYPWMQPTMMMWYCSIYCWKKLTYQWAHMVLFKGQLYFQFKKCVLTGRKHFWRKKYYRQSLVIRDGRDHYPLVMLCNYHHWKLY